MRTGRPAARSSLGKWILKRWLYWSCTRALVKALPAQWPNRAMSQPNMSSDGSPSIIHSAASLPMPPDCEKPGMMPLQQK